MDFPPNEAAMLTSGLQRIEVNAVLLHRLRVYAGLRRSDHSELRVSGWGVAARTQTDAGCCARRDCCTYYTNQSMRDV